MDWMSYNNPQALMEEWNAILQKARPGSRVIFRSAGLKVTYLDHLRVQFRGREVELGQLLRYHTARAAELHARDRVHTYGSFYIADLPDEGPGPRDRKWPITRGPLNTAEKVLMALVSDLRILYHLIFTRGGGEDPAGRLEAFYHQQAGMYDDFRRRLLHGREEMIEWLEVPDGGRMLDMGGGTGSNLEYLGQRRERLQSITIVDLCPSLLRVALERIQRHGWHNVATVQADVTTYEPEDGPVDVVIFSYALTMMPCWFKAIDHAQALLKPGGLIGVADFYISQKWPTAGLRKHSRFQRFFWPWWFNWDNVFLSADHLPYLQSRFRTVRLEERVGRLPYCFGLKAPYYLFLGRKE
jgi:S-adenosylmethionine-diacylgycerolhomoserine-N-methlytransferase